jgi:N utilization substance protein A
MFDLKSIVASMKEIAEEREIPEEKVTEIIEAAFAHAYKKEYRDRNEIIRATFDPRTGDIEFFQVKEVMDETMLESEDETATLLTEDLGTAKKVRFDPARHIMLEEATAIKPDIFVGEELLFPLEAKTEFGRIAAQTAKQVLLQKLHEMEREIVLDVFKQQEGEIVSGIIQRMDGENVHVDLGKAVGMLFAEEMIPGERYRVGNRMKFYIVSVEQGTRGILINLSRSHPKFVVKLFANEVPEIADGIVEIKAVAREAGSRTKIAVSSHNRTIDPQGSCIGQRGTRVTTVMHELGEEEKIDIILWSDDPAVFVGNALSPATATEVQIRGLREARVLVPHDQLSLAIGKSGQNARLAAKLTGWHIEIRSETKPEETVEGGITTVIEEKREETERAISEEPSNKAETPMSDHAASEPLAPQSQS